MGFFRLIILLWNHRKEIDYVKRKGKVPVCGCKYFLETDNDCEHIINLRQQINDKLKK